MLPSRRLALGAAAFLLLAAGCADVDPIAPLAPSAPARSGSASGTPIYCPSTESVAVSQTIGLLGGVIELVDAAGGVYTLTFPLNAVSLPTIFTVSLPASDHMTVRVEAKVPLTGISIPLVFPTFARPTLTVSYARCAENVPSGALQLYNTDSVTGEVLEGPFGHRIPGTTLVTGRVPHFSDYSIGAP